MDFDPTNNLKRCSSTPTISQILPATSTKISVTSSGSYTMNSSSAPNNHNMNSSTSRSRDASPTPALNIFAPRARRYSTGFSPLATNPGPLPRLTPRVSQLRQEECADLNSREVNHEREVHTALQISQSWEDLSLDAEHWSFKSDTITDLTNPLQVTLPTGIISCSSPSPTSSRAGLRLPAYGLSPSPTRRTFQTRRSMSPIAMRPSSLGPVKRKFELDDNYSNSYSPPPFKKIFTERGQSPCRSPLLQTCPSPDSTEGRTTPKFYISKLYTTNTNSSSSQSSSLSAAASPSSTTAMEIPIDMPSICSGTITNTDLMNNSAGLTVPIINNNQSTHSAANSDLNSDLDCSDIDVDSDTQIKPTMRHRHDKSAQKRDETCAQLKHLFFSRVSTDSAETDCSIDFKSQTICEPNFSNDYINGTTAIDNRIENSDLSIDCDSTHNEKLIVDANDAILMMPNFVGSMADGEVKKLVDISVNDADMKAIIKTAINVSTTDMCASTNAVAIAAVADEVVVVINNTTNSTETL